MGTDSFTSSLASNDFDFFVSLVAVNVDGFDVGLGSVKFDVRVEEPDLLAK